MSRSPDDVIAEVFSGKQPIGDPMTKERNALSEGTVEAADRFIDAYVQRYGRLTADAMLTLLDAFPPDGPEIFRVFAIARRAGWQDDLLM